MESNPGDDAESSAPKQTTTPTMMPMTTTTSMTCPCCQPKRVFVSSTRDFPAANAEGAYFLSTGAESDPRKRNPMTARPAAFDSDMFGGAMGSSSLGNVGSGMGLSGTSPGNDRGISTIHPMLPSRATRGFYNDLKSKLVSIVFLMVHPWLLNGLPASA